MNEKETAWSLNTDYEESLDINIQLEKIISVLKEKKEILVELKKKYELSFKFIIVIRIEQKQAPAIYFEKNTIEFANKIQAEFDFDLYVF